MAGEEVALKINRRFERASESIVARFRSVSTGNICDGQGRSGALDYRIKPISRKASFAGVALTVETVPKDNLAPWAALDIAKPGDVVVISTGEYFASSVIGDVYVGMARNRGVLAIVTDGVVRDVEGINAVGIPVFACGVSPNSPWKNGPGGVGFPIVIGGMTVHAGDILVGDPDGVVIVSRMKAEEVAEELKAVLAKEAKMEADVKAGKSIPGWLVEAYKAKGVRYID
jgi:4-hydroxy-4-methyl-2-oxoglutarate aldolase